MSISVVNGFYGSLFFFTGIEFLRFGFVSFEFLFFIFFGYKHFVH